MRELVYYAAVSLDGHLASPDGAFDAFSLEGDHMADLARFADAIPTAGADHLGIAQDRSCFDTVLMGWNTYAVGLGVPGGESPYRHLRQIVFSRNHTGAGENLTVTDDDPVDVVRSLKDEAGSSIWLCGGGNLATQLADEIDRIVFKRHPIVFGGGIPAFAPNAYSPRRFDLVDTKAFTSGVEVVEYARSR
ncbi:dihydrofolate reductase [Rhodococcus rhodnii]|nr:dihydrofolate reductase family protein [Rhodococcus rhodnii]TXG89596.1 dihydrofolate reductase [Rhodococcus rhodnii]